MAKYTQTQLLNAFCDAKDYDTEKEVDETKSQFVSRIEREWAKREAVKYLAKEARNTAHLQAESDAQGVTL